jgi:hypothetical protein
MARKRNGGRRASQDRFSGISKAGSQIVRDAAALLDEELAAGIVAARNAQQRFEKERKIDPADIKVALQRFQGDAHEVVNLLNDQFGELRAEENGELIKRLVTNVHDLVDVVVGAVNMGVEVANQLTEAALPKPDGTSTRRRR